MKLRLLDILACPRCGDPFGLEDARTEIALATSESSEPQGCTTCRVDASEPHRSARVAERDCVVCYRHEITSGRLVCQRGHAFAIEGGVARLTPESELVGSERTGHESAAGSIQATYDTAWSQFRYGDKTWSRDLEDRLARFIDEVEYTPDELAGKLILDAGCGTGILTRGVNRFGCESVGFDVSDSVSAAHRHYASIGNDRAHFLQCDLVRHPFRDGVFDIVYAGGVLHCNPDPRAAFFAIVRALKPGGRAFMWLYRKKPGLAHRLRQLFRSCVLRLPQPVRKVAVAAWLPQSMLRQYLRTLLGRNDEKDRLKWRERYVLLLDHYTPEYRWELTQDQVAEWYRKAGLRDVRFEPNEWGFGVTGRKPSARDDQAA